MLNFFTSRTRSFKYAFSGWWFVIRTQRNAWIHAVASICVIGLGLWLQIEARDWAVLILTIGTVWMAEFINTALEVVVDLSTPGHHPLARIGKDVGAAAVLITAFSSIVIGGLILGPPLWTRISPLLH
jgi:diacylglycerol kinase (ATP)